MSQRKEITRLLAEQDKRLLVIVDDLDRLPKVDIRELFKLVRLTADFPNTTYLLAFDRPRVEAALGETQGEGRAYLEKILQVTFDVPVLRGPDLTNFLLAEIQNAIGSNTIIVVQVATSTGRATSPAPSVAPASDDFPSPR